jgi:hypothetical protein
MTIGTVVTKIKKKGKGDDLTPSSHLGFLEAASGKQAPRHFCTTHAGNDLLSQK